MYGLEELENEANPRAVRGSNHPPSDAELLQASLNEKTEQLQDRYTSLCQAVERMPEKCEDDATAGKIGDMIKLISACSKSFETMRVGEKEPFLNLSRSVDGFFKKFTEGLDFSKKKANKPLEVYLLRKAEEKRAAERAAALAQRAEAERLEAEARALEAANMQKPSEDALKEAVRMDEQATKSEKASEAKPAELARTRGDYGSLATLRTTWVGEIVDRRELDLAAIAPFLGLDVLQKAVNAFVKSGGRDLRGAKIFEQSTAMVK